MLAKVMGVGKLWRTKLTREYPPLGTITESYSARLLAKVSISRFATQNLRMIFLTSLCLDTLQEHKRSEKFFLFFHFNLSKEKRPIGVISD